MVRNIHSITLRALKKSTITIQPKKRMSETPKYFEYVVLKLLPPYSTLRLQTLFFVFV